MSASSQGQGWWLASDGRWYPPEQHPGATQVAAPLQAAYPYRPTPPRTTCGMAVASLVLSLVWIGGLGSILGVVFGFVARSEIKRSAGAKSGDGIAIAGIAIGFVGLGGIALSIALLVALGTATRSLVANLAPRTVAYGTSVDISGSTNLGLQNLTVYSLTAPATSRVSGAPSGIVLMAARMRVCATSSGSQGGFDASTMNVYFSDEQTGRLDLVATVQGMGRNLNRVSSLAAGRCVSGYLPFDVAPGTRPIGVEYVPFSVLPFNAVRWED